MRKRRQTEREELIHLRRILKKSNLYSRRLLMDPNEIVLENLSKSFEYTKLAKEIDSCDDREMLKDIAKSYAKLYLKQQEVVGRLGI